jgi:hypothetical protein
MYADSTWLSKSGSHSIKPLAMTIGNFPRDSMNQDRARKVTFNKNIKFFNKILFSGCWLFSGVDFAKDTPQKSRRKTL